MTRHVRVVSVRRSTPYQILFLLVCLWTIAFIAPAHAQRRPPLPAPSPTSTPPRRVPEVVVQKPGQKCFVPDSLTVLTAAGPTGTSVILQNIKASPGGCGGQGDLAITLAGQHLATLTGSLQTDGSVALKNDLVAADVFGSGVDLVFEKDGKIITKQPGAVAEFSGGIRMRLPYFSASGERAELELGQTIRSVTGTQQVPASLLLKSDGGFSISQKVQNLVKPAIKTASDGLKLAGFTVIPYGMSINFSHPGVGGKPFDLLVTTGANVTTFIPYLPTQDDAPIPLTVGQLTLNEDGIVSFTDAQLNFAGGFHFAQPMDFAMNLTNADVSYSNDHFTKFVMNGTLILPTSLSDRSTPANPQRAQLGGVRLTLNNQKWDVTPGDQVITMMSNVNGISFGTDPQSLYKLTIQSYSVDLSPNGGVKVKSGSLSGGMFGQPVQVNDGDLFIDTFGISGSVALPGSFTAKPKVGGFQVNVTADANSRVEFKRNARIGEANLPGQVVLQDMGALSVRVYLPDNGTAVITTDPNQPLTTLALNKYHVGIAVSAAALQPRDDGNYSLSLSGALAFNTGAFGNLPVGAIASDFALPFNDLGLDATKGFIGSSPDGMINLDNPADVDLGLFNLNVSQFRFPIPGDDAIKLTGGVKLSGDLPITGELDFTGLKITSGGSLDFGKISFTDLAVMDVATISGSLEKRDIAVGDDPPKSYLFGDVTKFDLNIAGEMHGQLHFLVGNGSWLVLGSVQLPDSIELGDSGLALFGFRGGLGHNVKLRNPIDPNFRAADLQSTDFLPTNDGSWLFQAGVRIGTDDGYLLWGDATMMVTTQPLVINLNVAGYLLEEMNDSPSGDRTALANMTYDSGTQSFRATAQVDLTFPTRSASIASATGSADLLISKSDQHIWIGWPPFAPVAVKVLSIGQQGGLALGPGKHFGTTFTFGGSFYFISGEVDGRLDADLNQGFVLVGVLHASGGVDFLIFSASAEAMLQAQMQSNPFELDLTGQFDACIGVPFGHICKTLGPATFVIK